MRPLDRAAVALAVLGVGIAGYLTVAHYGGIDPVCTSGGGCERVQTSEYADLAGVPVALLGLLGYVAILAALLLPGEAALLAAAGLAVGGLLFSGYLQFRSFVTLEEHCVWCIASALTMTALCGACVARVLRAP
ncbi:vitamin K epoxide reductase family protein [Conexibacter sp. SYSU D00693]|uniref:vitamin K epoxide reductase family protein n=1 Tax=Conexibacter sp. SYSU D00693 TaxID=2812560 RepID=UPI00196B82E5|nr:vitamin K epoxide reductase family protein [Conexibacter sp. SYSU D00693]